MRTFVLGDEKASRFWNIELESMSYTVQYGKVGSKGRSRTKNFENAEQARQAYEKAISEKLEKGYVENTPTETAPRSLLLDNLEQALVDNPEDLASHSAFADYLMEQDDPRGELIQVQLALEDPATTAKKRKSLQKREQELLDHHARAWLGDLGRFLVGNWSGDDKPWNYTIKRGWLHSLRLLPFLEPVFASLAREPQARLLQELEVIYDMRYHWEQFDPFIQGPGKFMNPEEQILYVGEDPDYTWDDWTWDFWEWYDEDLKCIPFLLESPHLSNLRSFRIGFSEHLEKPSYTSMSNVFETCTMEQILQLLEKCPKLEQLYLNTSVLDIDMLFASELLGQLRVFQYFYGESQYYAQGDVRPGYPLEHLAENPALKKLETLRLHPGKHAPIELENLDHVLSSPNFHALRNLRVSQSTFGDDGWQAIVESGILRRLESLDLSYGNATDTGAKLLAECADLQHLDTLNVSANSLTETGIQTLHNVGINVIANDQHAADDPYYLWDVDWE